MKGWFLVPLAAIVGLVAGSWGPREDLRRVREAQREESVKGKVAATTGFDAFAKLTNIPDVAKRKPTTNAVPRAVSTAAGKSKSSLGEAELGDAAGETHRGTEELGDAAGETHRGTEELGDAADETQRGAERTDLREDLGARLEQAAELWNTRVALAKAQWTDLRHGAGV